MNLSFFQKPSRYINSEVNSLKKDAEIKVALAFPDIYDVGMSHLGLKILYKIINDIPYASAERAFHPWLDMEKGLRDKGELLSSLETDKPLKDFDIVGFSLQYELSYTAVLNMLDLGGIPLKTEDRIKNNFPLIIAGGPCTVNPLPMSKFIDAFLIGDGEEAIVEIVNTYKKWKKEGDSRKESLLKMLSGIKGIYVPTLHATHYKLHAKQVIRRFIESLDSAPYPDAPVVPYTSIVHDRVNIEVSRGCTMGCRFCHAGMIYRPLRERSPENILRIAEKSLKNTGHEDVSFTSLSAGDYSCLHYLMKTFNEQHSNNKISLSLPSLRVSSVNRDILREIKSIRKTGFTIAPEAATDRLRNVINKDFTAEDYEQSLKILFEEGWLNLKLYFMIGLPTEIWEDIEAIPQMAFEALKIAKRHTKKFVNINITVSPFVPKSHTPFQWCGQENMSEIKKKSDYLRDAFRKKRLNFKGHDEKMSVLEAVFARGDERLSDLIETAWSLGCRLDAWGESFDFSKWNEAMDKTGIQASSYAEKTYKKEDSLPWDIIDIGVNKEYLYKEYERAMSGSKTGDCRKNCYACGLNCPQKATQRAKERENFENIDQSPVQLSTRLSAVADQAKSDSHDSPDKPIRRIRVEFSKTGRLRYLSHLEIVTAMFRAMRRADLQLLYSQGFHPAPKVAFGPALNVGVSGLKEYFDMEIMTAFDLDYLMAKINSVLPEGLRINDTAPISGKEQSLSSFVSRYEYEIRYREPLVYNQKEGIKHQNIEDILPRDNNTVKLILIDSESKKAKLSEIVQGIFNIKFEELEITRLAMYGWKESWTMPIERRTLCLTKS